MLNTSNARSMMRNVLRASGRILQRSVKLFSSNDPLRMGAATAFFTTFALPPILIIIIQLMRLIFTDHVGRKILSRLSGTIGQTSTRQVAGTLKAVRELASDWYITLAGIFLLLFVATNLFKIIRDSINQIWKIKPVKHRSFVHKLKVRWQGLLIILATALLFSVAIFSEGILAYFREAAGAFSPGLAGYMNSTVDTLFSFLLVTAWFMLLFSYLPDGKPHWKVALAGALFTGILFTLGKFLLGILLVQSSLNNLFGASAALVLLLLFVFYSALILYFGAAFTQAWADAQRLPIVPKTGAVRYKITEVREN